MPGDDKSGIGMTVACGGSGSRCRAAYAKRSAVACLAISDCAMRA